MPSKYGPKAQKKVKKVMHEFKAGELKSGQSRKKVKSRKQAIAIALSEARESGAKVPPARKARSPKKKASKKTSQASSESVKTGTRKNSPRSSAPALKRTAQKVAKQPGSKKSTPQKSKKGARQKRNVA